MYLYLRATSLVDSAGSPACAGFDERPYGSLDGPELVDVAGSQRGYRQLSKTNMNYVVDTRE